MHVHIHKHRNTRQRTASHPNTVNQQNPERRQPCLAPRWRRRRRVETQPLADRRGGRGGVDGCHRQQLGRRGRSRGRRRRRRQHAAGPFGAGAPGGAAADQRGCVTSFVWGVLEVDIPCVATDFTYIYVHTPVPGSFYAPAGGGGGPTAPRQQQQRRWTTAVDPGEDEETGAALLPIAGDGGGAAEEEGGEGDAAFLGRVKAARPKTSLALGGCVVFLAGGERCEAVSRVSNGKREQGDSHISTLRSLQRITTHNSPSATPSPSSCAAAGRPSPCASTPP